MRASLQAAMDCVSDDEIDVAYTRLQLQHVEKQLRSLELSLYEASSREAQRLEVQETELSGQSAALDEDYGRSDPDTAKWLLDTFTENNDDVADSNFELQVSRTTSLKTRRSRTRAHTEEALEALLVPSVAVIMENCGDYSFDSLGLASALQETTDQSIPIFGAHVLQYRGGLINCIQQRGWIKDAKSFSETFLAFLSQLDSLYLSDVRYHNSAHAVDVMATMDVNMRSKFVLHRSTSLDHLMALAAAAIHDVGHPGRNNMFQVKTMTYLAIQYNDKSVLENMHASLAFQTMQQNSNCNWLALLSKDADTAKDTDSHQMSNLPQYVRQGIIRMVLATDMAKHQKYVLKLAELAAQAKLAESPEATADSARQDKGPAKKQEALEDKFFILETMLHAADLSNPCKARSIALAWTRRVCEEFWLQGDEERNLGLAISPMCDRVAGAATVPQGQLGFINFVVKPLLSPLAELAPEIQLMKDQLAKNAAFWEEKEKEGASFVQLFGEEPWVPSGSCESFAR